MRSLLCRLWQHRWETSIVAGHSNWRTCRRCAARQRQHYQWTERWGRPRRVGWTAALLVVLLVAASCAGDSASGGRLAPAASVSEARLWQEYAESWGHEIATVFAYLWTGSEVRSIDVEHFPDDSEIRVDYWCGGPITFTIAKPHYDPELSRYEFGPTATLSSNEQTLPGHSYLYDLRAELEPAKFNQVDSVTLAQERSTTLASSFEINYTVSSETTVGGTLFGASLEEKLSMSLGVGSKHERTTAESESTSRTEEHEFDIDLESQKATLITLTSPDLNTATPMNALLVPAHGVAVDLRGPPCEEYLETGSERLAHVVYDWQVTYRAGESTAELAREATDAYYNRFRAYGPGFLATPRNLDWSCGGTIYGGWKLPCTLTFESKDRLNQMLNGTHERWQGMTQYGATWRDLSCSNHRWISGAPGCYSAYAAATEHPAQWAIHLAGTQHRTYESAIKEVVELVAGDELDKLLADDTIQHCDAAETTC